MYDDHFVFTCQISARKCEGTGRLLHSAFRFVESHPSSSIVSSSTCLQFKITPQLTVFRFIRLLTVLKSQCKSTRMLQPKWLIYKMSSIKCMNQTNNIVTYMYSDSWQFQSQLLASNDSSDILTYMHTHKHTTDKSIKTQVKNVKE